MTRTPWGDPPRLLLACLCLLAACGAARVGGQDAAVLPAPLPAPQPAPQPESQPAPLPAAQPVAQPDALPATQSETAALLAFEQAVVGTKAGLGDGLPGWTPDTNPCSATASWAGVSCTGGSVTSIVLPGAELRGTLPAALNLSKLTVLDLGGNRLEGGLPPTLRLPSLLRLLLGNNQLTGTLPPIWTQNFPRLREMALQGNKLAGTMPPAWTEAAGFGVPFTATVQPSNPLLCGAVTLGANHTLLYSGPASTDAAGGGGDGQSTQHEIITTLGSCAQDGNCGGATVNASAPNLFDLAWGNRVAVLDLEYFNPSVQQNGEPKQGSPVTLPCYPTEPPTFFGSDAAWRKATWQAGSAGNRSSYLPVSGNRQPQGPGNCSLTLDAPGFWMVDLQRETSVMGVLVRAGPEQMQGVDIRVSSEPTPTSGDVCKGGDSYDPGEGKIVLCQRVLQGRYVSISSTSRVSLCVVEVYPVVGNAALGKPTSASAGTGDATQSSQVVNGNMANTACATVVSGTDLSAWITVDLGYEAAVETVVVQNGFSDFLNNDLYIRLGNTPVVVGNENPVCSQGQTLASRNTLPIQCTGPGGGPALGRFLTLYRKINQASDMYICQVLAFLSAGPNTFYQSPPLPPPPPLSPPPAPPPPAPRGAVDITVTDSTVTMLVSMELSGPGLVPLDKAVQDNIVRAASAAWDGNLGMRNVRGLEFEGVNPVSRLSAQAQAQGRALLQGTGAGGGAGPTFNISDSGWVSVQLAVDTSAGQAPDAAQFVAESGYPGGALPAELANEGMDGVVSTIQAISDLGSPPSPAPAPEASPQPGPDPAPAPPAPSPSGAEVTTSSSGAPIGAIVGGVMGGVLVALAAAAALLFVRRRRRRRGGPGPGSEQGDDGGSESPKVGAMEQGLHSSADLLGLPKSGEANGYNLAVAAASGVGYDAASLKLALDGEQLPQGPPVDIISFLADDQGSDHTAMGGQPSDWTDGGLGSAAASTSGVLRTSSDGGLSALVKQKSMASRHDQGVSELWTVDFGELGIEKQIGEGSFGKVYLARWRETTVAVKVLGAMGTGTSPGLDDEFPDAATSKGHPLYESLQKEAAMMASLRHPSIVMYLGVCLDPPAVVTEYCARGSLSDVLKRARSSPLLAAQLDWARRLGMALDAAKGMLYLHSCSPPIIHRDLKSANLLVDKHWRVRVCDFNLSRVMEDSAVLSSVAATNPRWLAPEILSGKGYTFASDVYSFGICMWEMLTWQVPYHEYGPWQVVAMVTESSKRPEVPALSDLPTGTFGGEDEYLSLMCECWAQDPAQRPTFATVISRLRKMLGLETSARRDSPTKSVRSMPPLRTGAPEGGSGGGNGTDDTGTPGSCSHVAASLNGASSELCLSPDRLLSPSPSETEPLVLSGSPGMLSGLNASAGSSPPRPARRSSGSDAPLGLRPLSSRAAGSSRDDAEDAAEAAAAPEAALPPAGSSPAVG